MFSQYREAGAAASVTATREELGELGDGGVRAISAACYCRCCCDSTTEAATQVPKAAYGRWANLARQGAVFSRGAARPIPVPSGQFQAPKTMQSSPTYRGALAPQSDTASLNCLNGQHCAPLGCTGVFFMVHTKSNF